MRRLADERGVILNWFARIAVGFVVIGVGLFDGGSIVVNYVGLDSTADDIVHSLATDIAASSGEPSPQMLADDAKALARDADARVVSVSIDDAGELHLGLKRTANTLVVSRIDALAKWANATAEAQASTE
jgi:hypothetical protein